MVGSVAKRGTIMMKINATPIGSAIPTLSERDLKVETGTEFEIALSYLRQAADRLKSAGLQRKADADQEIPLRRINR